MKIKGKEEVKDQVKQTPVTTTGTMMDGNKKVSNNMVFLSNLSYDVKQEDIENVFKNVSDVYLIFRVRNKTEFLNSNLDLKQFVL